MRCINCFAECSEIEKCSVCGYSLHIGEEEPLQMKPGTMLKAERYYLGRVIGVGGFGITYVAWDTVLEKKVAIKEYMPGEFSTRLQGQAKVTVYGGEKEEQFRDGLAKFQEESQRLAAFREVEGIVQIYDCFLENETGYIVMEYLEGETLGERLKREGKIPVDEAVSMILPVLDALEIVHNAGIVHRDIAPNNIFICKDGKVKLLDFGAARSATGTHSKSLTVLYKEGYTAEEQYRSRGDQGTWTDVYSISATLYKAITGITPDGAMERRRKDKLKKPGKCGVKVPSNVEKAIMNALNMDIKKRTQTTGQFKAELISKKPVSNRFKRTEEKKVGKIPKGVLAVILICLVTGFSFIGLLFTGIIEFNMETFTNLFVEDGYARVMNVVNMEENEARERLAALGLELEVTQVKYSNKVQEGRIISQQEEKGEVVAEGTVIHVLLSKGAGIVTVPDMLNQKWEEMELILDDLCLEYTVERQQSLEPPGYVIGQDPVAETNLEQGQSVTVTVSEGMGYSEDTIYIMENYQGVNAETAKMQMAENGLYLLDGDTLYDDYVSKGCILYQDIPEGTEVHGGDIVTVDISLGPEPQIMPDMVGKTQLESENLLQERGLIATVVPVLNMENEEGTVISQSIVAGEMVEKFSEVTLEIAYHGVEIPNFIGKTEQEVAQICVENNCVYEVEYVLRGNNTVVSQEPKAGTLVDKGSKITVNIGISESDFSNRLLGLINQKRSLQGMGQLSFSEELNNACSILAKENANSTDCVRQDGRHWATVLSENFIGYYNALFTSRNNITTLSNANGRLKYAGNSYGDGNLLTPEYTKIGMAYTDDNALLIIVICPR